MSGDVEFGELVTLLDKVAPDRLEAIRRIYPEHSVQLRPGGVMGESSLTLGCTIALESLKAAGPAALTLVGKLRRRLAWSWRFDLIAKLATAAGAASAIGLLASNVIGLDKVMIASAVTLLGSLAGLVFSFLQRDEGAGSVPEAYNKLIKALVELDRLQRVLPPLCAESDNSEVQAAVASANSTAQILNELTLRFG
jgi:hypothetical protein